MQFLFSRNLFSKTTGFTVPDIKDAISKAVLTNVQRLMAFRAGFDHIKAKIKLVYILFRMLIGLF